MDEQAQNEVKLTPAQEARIKGLLEQIERALRGLDLGETEPVTVFRPEAEETEADE